MSPEFDQLHSLYTSDPRTHLHAFAVLWATTLKVNDKEFETPFPTAVRLCAMRKYRELIMERVPDVRHEDIDRWIAGLELEYRDAKVAEAPDDAQRVVVQELWLSKACQHMMNAIAEATPDSVAALCRELDVLYSPPLQLRLLKQSWGQGLEALLFFIPNKERFDELLKCLDHEPEAIRSMCIRLHKALRADGGLSQHILNEFPVFIQSHVLGRVVRLRFVSRVEIRKAVVELQKELGCTDAGKWHRAVLRRMFRKSAFVRKVLAKMSK